MINWKRLKEILGDIVLVVIATGIAVAVVLMLCDLSWDLCY